MIINLPGFGDSAEHKREGIMNAKAKKNHLTYKDHEHKGYTTYLYSPKAGQDPEKEELRLKYSYQNYMSAPSPFDYFGTPEYNEMVEEFAEEATRKWIENQEQYSKIRKKYKNKTYADPLDQELILSLLPEEVADLKGNPDAIAERLLETSLELVRQYTNKKEISNDLHIKMHLDTDNPHAHIRIGYYDRYGQALRIMHSAERLGKVHFNMEQDLRKFPWLSKIRTNAWEEQGRLTPEDIAAPIIATVVSILEQYPNDPIKARKALIAAGIKTDPTHKKNQVDNVEFIHQGNKINAKYHLTSQQKALAFKHIELTNFVKESKIDPVDAIPLLEQILAKHKGKNVLELSKSLDDLGWNLEVNTNAKGKHGWTLVWKDTASRIKCSRITFNQDDYAFSPDDLNALKSKTTEYKSKHQAENQSPINVQTGKVVVGKKYRKDKNGQWMAAGGFIGFERKKKKKYMRWEKYKTETLEEFILRISEQRRMIALIKQIRMEGNIGYNVKTGVQAFKVISDTRIEFNQNNPTSIRAGLQAMIAQNQLTQEEVAKGVELTVRVSGTDQKFLDNFWIEAKLAGLKPLGITPTPEAQQKYKAALDNDLTKHRLNNKTNLVNFLNARDAGADPEDQNLRINYNNKLEIEVDRRAMALAYVDAWLMGLEPSLVLNPPGTHQNSRNRAFKEDLVENYALMLKEVQTLRPDLLETFKKLTAEFSPEMQVKPEQAIETPASQPEQEDLPEYKEEQKRKEKLKST